MGRPKGSRNRVQPEGARSASGRIRNRELARVAACDGVVRRKEALGVPANDTNTCDALGRAYGAGLLGTNGQELLNRGRTVAWQWHRTYARQFPTADSLARLQPIDGPPLTDEEAAERDRECEDALNKALAAVKACGFDTRRAFDQLVIDLNPDEGPAWLDRLIWAGINAQTPGQSDARQLQAALRGLETIL